MAEPRLELLFSNHFVRLVSQLPIF
jgi:hypothetical protein